jgi:hypothetical protein
LGENKKQGFTVASDDSVEPDVGVFSTIKLNKPVRIVDTDHAGFLKRIASD